MSKEKFELGSYTADAGHHMLKVTEHPANDGMLVVV